MKTYLVLFFWLIGATCWGQENSTTLAAASLVEIPTQSSTMAVPGVKSLWQISLGSETYSYEADQRLLGSRAPVVSYNWIGAVYNLSPRWALELRQHFQYASNVESLSGRDKLLHQGNLAMAETMVNVGIKNWSLWGSKPGLFEVRYYAPTDRAAQLKEELGRLRANAYVEWMLNSKWSLAAWGSPRIQLNSVGDAEYYQLRGASYLTHYFNDSISSYYACSFNGKSSQAQRGDWTPDLANISAHEVGMYLGMGPVIVNPTLMSETSLNDGQASLLSNDSRIFAYETLSYNLNIYAVF